MFKKIRMLPKVVRQILAISVWVFCTAITIATKGSTVEYVVLGAACIVVFFTLLACFYPIRS